MNWRKSEENNIFIEKGAHKSFGSGEFVIRCNKGIIWLTWPWNDDVILSAGEEISFRTDGTLCMKAFTGALVNIKKRKVMPCMKSIPRLLAVKTFTTIVSFIKDGEGYSVFGDSVHSITR